MQSFSLPLPIFKSIHIADAVSKDGEEFDLFIGLSEKYLEQLKKFSQDESDLDLQNNTGDNNRFGRGSYEEWYKKSRTLFCLIHKRTDVLAAIVWFGPKPLGKKFPRQGAEEEYKIQNSWHTIAWRSYLPFRGRGIMKNFTKFAMNIYRVYFPDMKLWAGMDDRNTATLKLASGLGFEADEENSNPDAHWLVMTKKSFAEYHIRNH